MENSLPRPPRQYPFRVPAEDLCRKIDSLQDEGYLLTTTPIQEVDPKSKTIRYILLAVLVADLQAAASSL